MSWNFVGFEKYIRNWDAFLCLGLPWWGIPKILEDPIVGVEGKKAFSQMQIRMLRSIDPLKKWITAKSNFRIFAGSNE